MKARPGVILGTLCGVLGAGVLFAPARWLADAVEHVSHGQVQWRNVQGSIWDGQADVVLTGGGGSRTEAALPRGLQWRLRPGWQGGPALHWYLRAPCCTPDGLSGTFVAHTTGWTLDVAPHQSHWPATWLTGLGTPWNTVRLEGQLRLQTPGLGWRWSSGGLRASGEATVEALDLSSTLSTLRPLGSYRLHIGLQGNSPSLRLSTLRGDLQLTGQAEWTGGRFRFRGLAEANPQRLGALSNLLNILGRRDGPRAHMSLG